GLDKLRQEEFGLIISDWDTQPMSGLQFLREVRDDAKLKHIPFIIIMADSNSENVIAAKNASVSNLIVSPFNTETLKSKLVSVLGNF
ncbi:MAG: response regulator, partial [Nitrospirales bacterium]